jgi:hypothetical protein
MSPHRVGLAVACLVGFTLAAHAEEPARPNAGARIGSLGGTVSVRGAGQPQWRPAAAERQLAPGDDLWTQPGAQAKLELGHAAVALQEKTQVQVGTLSGTDTEFRIVQGALELSVPALGRGESYQIQTPRGVMRVMQAGRFVVEAGSGELPTKVTALAGTAQLVGTESGLIVSTGQTGVVTGVDGGLSYAVQLATAPEAPAQTAAASAEPPPAAEPIAAEPVADKPPPVVEPAPGEAPAVEN